MTILEIFRVIAPEFKDVPDATVQANIDIYADMISRANFGKYYERAVAFYTAHNMALSNIMTASGSSSTDVTGGAIIREKEGDLEHQFAEGRTSSDLLNKTVYGKQYLDLMRLCIVPVTIRKRGCF
ncbi:Protein of unknown function [Anaerovibrio lipolyticus DSM 3074]|uniref:DUF4054 domain-containing protein n=1 Tax=Anaerovibrio lipolyticus DSM 3074 TaxID=1120997 RepID=A0A1M6CMH2_9FIRM|nr:DUF4054 domain-containing protein [Anaerovibrio lipolyticus]SHI61984.1 Protein of unknown function [Anaerovibrio lipolyticus DSM 3074]